MVYLSVLSVASVQTINIYMSNDVLTRFIQRLRKRSTGEESLSCIIGGTSDNCHSSVHHHCFGLSHGGFYYGGLVHAICRIRSAWLINLVCPSLREEWKEEKSCRDDCNERNHHPTLEGYGLYLKDSFSLAAYSVIVVSSAHLHANTTQLYRQASSPLKDSEV